MKKPVIIIFLLLSLFFNLFSQNRKNERVVRSFFQYMNESNFKEISNITGAEFTITEGGQVLCSSETEFYPLFQWDSVFSPAFEVIEINHMDGYIQATVSKSCERIRFLHDSPLVYNVDILIDRKQIIEMRTRNYLNADFRKWTVRREMLRDWMNEHYPEFPEFINDISIEGAQNYITAMKLYEEYKNE